MMWGVLVVFVCVPAFVAPDEITVECDEFYDFPPINSPSPPSVLADMNAELLKVGENHMLNVSWAINIDASIASLDGTHIEVSGEPVYRCEYKPPLSQANFTEIKQKWFHYLIKVTYGLLVIQVVNVPLPPLGSGEHYKVTTINFRPPRVTARAPVVTTAEEIPEPPTSALTVQDIIVIVFGGLVGLMILGSCCVIYKNFRSSVARCLGLPDTRAFSVVRVPVLVVYPAEDAAFQQAVVALAEFLQRHGGCSVAVDMWQQERIAELGPMRWLAEQAKSAERVLVVCPRVKTCPDLAKPSIPAAAQDLYPLILNMVASRAKSASELTKFWVVQLCAPQDEGPCVLEPQLKACKSFCLMKDLNKLWKNLHAHRQSGRKGAALRFKPGAPFSKSSTVKLREAVDKLRRRQSDVPSEMLPFNSVIIEV